MKNDSLESLVKSGDIMFYCIENVDENGNVGKTSEFRNTERLTLVLPSGKKLVINTFCSGCAENTSLSVNIE